MKPELIDVLLRWVLFICLAGFGLAVLFKNRQSKNR